VLFRPHGLHAHREVGRAHLALQDPAQALPGAVEKQPVPGSVARRGEERQALQVVVVEMGEQDVEVPDALLGAGQGGAQLADARAGVDDEQAARGGADAQAGGVPAHGTERWGSPAGRLPVSLRSAGQARHHGGDPTLMNRAERGMTRAPQNLSHRSARRACAQ
jgi:hypothetical protein